MENMVTNILIVLYDNGKYVHKYLYKNGLCPSDPSLICAAMNVWSIV